MFQSIASYIWGTEEDEEEEEEEEEKEELFVVQCTHDDQDEVDNEWILVPIKGKEVDNNEEEDKEMLIGTTDERENEDKEEGMNGIGGKRQMLLKRVPLKDLNDKVALLRKNGSPKKLKRINKVHTRVNGTRKTKQYGRMEGKHIGMVGQRAK